MSSVFSVMTDMYKDSKAYLEHKLGAVEPVKARKAHRFPLDETQEKILRLLQQYINLQIQHQLHPHISTSGPIKQLSIKLNELLDDYTYEQQSTAGSPFAIYDLFIILEQNFDKATELGKVQTAISDKLWQQVKSKLKNSYKTYFAGKSHPNEPSHSKKAIHKQKKLAEERLLQTELNLQNLLKSLFSKFKQNKDYRNGVWTIKEHDHPLFTEYLREFAGLDYLVSRKLQFFIYMHEGFLSNEVLVNFMENIDAFLKQQATDNNIPYQYRKTKEYKHLAGQIKNMRNWLDAEIRHLNKQTKKPYTEEDEHDDDTAELSDNAKWFDALPEGYSVKTQKQTLKANSWSLTKATALALGTAAATFSSAAAAADVTTSRSSWSLLDEDGRCDFKSGSMGPHLFCDDGHLVISSSTTNARSLRGSRELYAEPPLRTPDGSLNVGIDHTIHYPDHYVGDTFAIPLLPVGILSFCTKPIIDDSWPELYGPYIYACDIITHGANPHDTKTKYASWVNPLLAYDVDLGALVFSAEITPTTDSRGLNTGAVTTQLYRCPGTKFTNLANCENPLGQRPDFPYYVTNPNRPPVVDPEYLAPGYNITSANSTIVPRYKTIETALGESYSITYKFIEPDRDAVKATMELLSTTSTNGVITSTNVGFIADEETDAAGDMVLSGMPPARSQGKYTFRVTIEDRKNAFELYGGKLVVDFDVIVKDKPLTSDVTPLPTPDIPAGASKDYTLTASAFDDPDKDEITIIVDGELPHWLSFDPASLRVFGTSSTTDRGSYNIAFAATTEFQSDPVLSQPVTFKVINTAPRALVQALPEKSFQIGDTATFGLIPGYVVDDESDNLLYHYELLGDSLTGQDFVFNNMTGEFAWTIEPGSEGSRIFSVWAEDLPTGTTYTDDVAFGLQSSAITITVNVEGREPGVKSIAAPAPTFVGGFDRTITNPFHDAGDGDKEHFTYAFSDVPSWMTVAYDETADKFNLSGNVPVGDAGSYVVNIIATDHTNKQSTASVNFEVVNRAPYVSSPHDAFPNVHAGEHFNFALKDYVPIADADGDLTSYNQVIPPRAWMIYDVTNQTISGVAPTGSADRYTMSVSGYDLGFAPYGKSSLPYAIDLNVVDRLPQIYGVPGTDITSLAGEYYTSNYQVTCIDEDPGDATTLTATGLPLNLELSSDGYLIGTIAPNQVGLHQVVFSCVESTYARTIAATLSMQVPNSAPSIKPDYTTLELNTNVGPVDAAQLKLPADFVADADLDSLTYSLGFGAPTGLGIDLDTGTFKGEIFSGAQGMHRFQVMVRDAHGAEAIANVELNVLNRAPIVVAEAPKVEMNPGDTKSYNVPVSIVDDLDNDALSWSVNISPEGGLPTSEISADGKNILITPRPTDASHPSDAGNYTLDYVVTDPSGASTSFQTAVEVINRPPDFTDSFRAITNVAVIVDVDGSPPEKFRFEEGLDDPDGDTLWLKMEQPAVLPEWATYNENTQVLTIDVDYADTGMLTLVMAIYDYDPTTNNRNGYKVLETFNLDLQREPFDWKGYLKDYGWLAFVLMLVSGGICFCSCRNRKQKLSLRELALQLREQARLDPELQCRSDIDDAFIKKQLIRIDHQFKQVIFSRNKQYLETMICNIGLYGEYFKLRHAYAGNLIGLAGTTTRASGGAGAGAGAGSATEHDADAGRMETATKSTSVIWPTSSIQTASRAAFALSDNPLSLASFVFNLRAEIELAGLAGVEKAKITKMRNYVLQRFEFWATKTETLILQIIRSANESVSQVNLLNGLINDYTTLVLNHMELTKVNNQAVNTTAKFDLIILLNAIHERINSWYGGSTTLEPSDKVLALAKASFKLTWLLYDAHTLANVKTTNQRDPIAIRKRRKTRNCCSRKVFKCAGCVTTGCCALCSTKHGMKGKLGTMSDEVKSDWAKKASQQLRAVRKTLVKSTPKNEAKLAKLKAETNALRRKQAKLKSQGKDTRSIEVKIEQKVAEMQKISAFLAANPKFNTKLLLCELVLGRGMILLLNDDSPSGMKYVKGTLKVGLNTEEHSNRLRRLRLNIPKTWSATVYYVMRLARIAQLGVYGSEDAMKKMDEAEEFASHNDFIVFLVVILKIEIASESDNFKVVNAAIDSLAKNLGYIQKRRRSTKVADSFKSKRNKVLSGKSEDWMSDLAKDALIEISERLQQKADAFKAMRKERRHRAYLERVQANINKLERASKTAKDYADGKRKLKKSNRATIVMKDVGQLVMTKTENKFAAAAAFAKIRRSSVVSNASSETAGSASPRRAPGAGNPPDEAETTEMHINPMARARRMSEEGAAAAASKKTPKSLRYKEFDLYATARTASAGAGAGGGAGCARDKDPVVRVTSRRPSVHHGKNRSALAAAFRVRHARVKESRKSPHGDSGSSDDSLRGKVVDVSHNPGLE